MPYNQSIFLFWLGNPHQKPPHRRVGRPTYIYEVRAWALGHTLTLSMRI